MAEIEGFNLPDELYYHKEHAWVKVEDGKARVGMNDMFQSEAGDIVFVDLPEEGDDIDAGEVCGKIQSAKWIGKLVAPISGEVAEVNEEVSDEPGLINRDPYGEGWIVVIEPSSLDDELGSLMQGEAVATFIKEEVAKAKAIRKEGASD